MEVAAARPLGARGSRREVSGPDPAAELSPTAAAVLAAIPAWWSARAARTGLTGRWLDVAAAIDTPPPLALGSPSQLEQEWGPLTGEQVGQAYVQALAAGTRARHGRHYTPPHLADHLWSAVRASLGSGPGALPLPGLVRDPACGAGALLLPALREHIRGSHGTDSRLILAGLPSLIEGIDTDPAAVWIANVVLAAEMLPLLRQVPEGRRRPLPGLCRVGDGLATDAGSARVVVMNPPYGRVRLTALDRERFADVLFGHANLYAVFLAAGEEQLSANGVLGALVPTSFTAGRYFTPLRRRLSSRLRLQSVTFVEGRSGVFTGVLQETCVAAFTRRRIRRTAVASLGEASTSIATVATPIESGPWLLPRRSDLAAVSAAAATMPLKLATAGWRASTGPLVWNRRKDDLAPTGGTRIVWAADLDGGVLHEDRRRESLRTIRLQSDADRATMRLTEPAVLVQRTTAPEQHRRVVAAEITWEDLADAGGAVVVENHVNVLRPTAQSAVSRQLLARLLGTRTLDAVARCIAGSVALSCFELESLPLPDAATLASWEELDPDQLERAVSRAYRPPAS